MKVVVVDFINKKRLFSFDDQNKTKSQLIDNVSNSMRELFYTILEIDCGDKEFEKWCAHVLARIATKLREYQ